jgi:hypothetical protein
VRGKAERRRQSSSKAYLLVNFAKKSPAPFVRLPGFNFLRLWSGGLASASTSRARRWRMANKVINVVLQLGTAHLQFFNFLVRSVVDLFFDPVNFVVQPMILVKYVPEMGIAALEAADYFAVLREFSEYRMMEVHGCSLLLVSCLILSEGDRKETKSGKISGLR